MLVSFIIPAYNAADTIMRCLESIYGLSLKREEFEVIVIDDASTDNTVEMVAAYSKPLPEGKGVQNLTLLMQPINHRQGAARNRGLKEAKGEYVCFVDADDAVTEGIVNAIRAAMVYNTEMTALHYVFVNENRLTSKEADRLRFKEGQLFSGIEMQNMYPYWCSAPWGYIYRCSFLKAVNYPFAEGVLFEDSDFVAVHLYHAKRMAYSRGIGYLAYEREGSTTRHISYKNVADYLLLGVRMMRFYERVMSEGMNELTNEREKFAEGILEGACWNIERAFHYMPRLASMKERRACYARIDVHTDRAALLTKPHLRKYYWKNWTKIGLSAPWLMMGLSAIVASMYRVKSKLRK